MPKKIIAVDLDDVLADSAHGFVEFSNKRWGTRLHPDDYDEHWAEMWGIDQKEAEDRSLEFHGSGAISNFLHKEESVAVLKLLAERYKLVITTSRRRDVANETMAWLERHYKDVFSEVYFAGIWDKKSKNRHMATKLDLCVEVGADYLIDDQPKHCNAVAGQGITPLLFGDYSWNRDANVVNGVIRVKSWQDVLEFFENEQ
jgi:5'(3')-deoxyribonucleotidase